MRKKVNFSLIGAALLALADEAIILVVVIAVLVQIGINIPVWAWIILLSIFLAITFIIYRTLRKSPRLGFENMVGLSGITVGPVAQKGTVKINGELWFARTRGEKIEAGKSVTVIEQTGLKLTVVHTPKEYI